MSPSVLALAVALIQPVAPATPATVSGRVVDAVTRAPVADAEVVLIPSSERPSEAFPRVPMRTTRADAEGRFVFEHVQAGRHTVQASGPGYVSRADGSPTLPVSLAGGDLVEGLELALSRGASVRGRVVGPDGRPVARAMIFSQRRILNARLSPAEGPSSRPPVFGTRFVSMPPRTEADAAGRFVLDGLAPGEYFLRATANAATSEDTPGSGRFTTLVPTYYPSTTDPVAGALPVMVVAGDDIAIGDRTMIASRAFGVSGTTVDADGRPMPDVSVRLVPPTSPAGALPAVVARLDTRSDRLGRFELRGVLPGDYLLVAVPAVVTNVDASPATKGSSRMSFAVGGSRPDAASGSVRTETRDGVTVQFRDEIATRVPVAIVGDPVSGLLVTVRRP